MIEITTYITEQVIPKQTTDLKKEIEKKRKKGRYTLNCSRKYPYINLILHDLYLILAGSHARACTKPFILPKMTCTRVY